MKGLGSLNKNQETKKKASTLIENVEVEKTTSRKILKADYDLLKQYAFCTEQNMTGALDIIFKKISRAIEKNGFSILPNIANIEDDKPEQKNVRISVEFNRYLKELSYRTEIPAKYLLTSCLLYLKDELIEDIKNAQTYFKF